ncbi:MBL fold metallo-hydrolase [Rhodoferax saidenbachensis]|uniref:Zn-dependent hydrolase n=1 Tax=Rhodoferax saidenbachensis TaxID=1484693 RepID=A0A1P8K6K9_9BURK|nr:MBL fold metallo-hydrolase [Rhodoferax saidenbachensis]APW41655.1 Zn-dependent hydrolase [Rhodoferax saidenbachensis]
MNDLELQLHYPLGEALPDSGRCLEVVPGIKWIRMTLPFALNHINLWLLRDEMDGPDGKVQGWSIVDCCISNDGAKAQWEDIFTHELEGLPVLRVIVTHMHPDHIGLAHWLCQRWNVNLWISALDYQVARFGTMGPTAFGGERAADFFAMHGLNAPDTVAQIKARTNYFPSLVPSVPEQYHRLLDGTVLQIGGHAWRCISGYGHAPEHMALYCDDLNVLIGGDMMLPRISTNVSVYEQEPEANSLDLFLDSIDKFKALPEDTLVLPSHGKPFTGMHTRIQQLHDHHRDRLAEVMEACAEKPCSGADILPVLFKRSMDLHQTTFAIGESIAHLHSLWFAGRLQRKLGDDGVLRFGVTPA